MLQIKPMAGSGFVYTLFGILAAYTCKDPINGGSRLTNFYLK